MPAGIQTGHKATIAFTTSAFTASFTKIGGFEMSRESLDTSHLGTTSYRTKRPGDLVDCGQFECEFFYGADVQPPITAVAETVTITLPDSTSGSGSGATIVGSGYISSFTTPDLVSDQMMVATMTVVWAGQPTFNDET